MAAVTQQASVPHELRTVPGTKDNPVIAVIPVGARFLYTPGTNLNRNVDGSDWIYVHYGAKEGWTPYKGGDFGNPIQPGQTPVPPPPTPALEEPLASLWLTLDEVRQFNGLISAIAADLEDAARRAREMGALLDKVIERALNGEADTTGRTS